MAVRSWEAEVATEQECSAEVVTAATVEGLEAAMVDTEVDIIPVADFLPGTDMEIKGFQVVEDTVTVAVADCKVVVITVVRAVLWVNRTEVAGILCLTTKASPADTMEAV
ncbi:hypothetical protein RvY_12761-3 [Ramazzottius varieornatus]|uniref:Uncharacterized protein n=1 Tax=Ramazzottius varieornatus TaxID=947166 RepID=A0A1D1VT77_RAMVA|nr:hypothetical protein RvY_12761-3 [Ramazzottius varieornatus]